MNSMPWLVGVDEAGRGPLAGPVCAAAVILHPVRTIDGLADSKKLTARRRESLAPLIRTQSAAWGIGWASVEEIDTHDILRATFMAMARAVDTCIAQTRLSGMAAVSDDAAAGFHVQVDGSLSPGNFDGPWHWPYVTEPVVRGDQKVPAISAASILAKTARDDCMHALHQQYPHYGFAQHAGYGTQAHLQALAAHGPCPAHRRSFAPVARLIHREAVSG
jgi:ribonuclease HII